MCRPGSYKVQAPLSVSSIGLIQTTPVKSSAATLTHNSSAANHKHHPHIVVQHHYHDHANEDGTIDDRPARGGVTTPFPIRLHRMLDQMAEDGHADVISWQPHGRCFVVHKPKEFKELLPIYFKLSKMSSFQRQLNLYGFQRLTRGRDKNGYYHEYFLRGKPALSQKIQRTKVKGTGVRARSNPATEPHLWEMAWVGTGAEQHHSDGGSVSSQEHSPPTSPKSMPPLVSSLPRPCKALLPPFVPQHVPLYQEQEAEKDIVMSFEGKQFHYLAPEEMMKEALLRKQQREVSKREDMLSFISDLELDSLYSQLDDELVDNDDSFMDMLERVIQ